MRVLRWHVLVKQLSGLDRLRYSRGCQVSNIVPTFSATYGLPREGKVRYFGALACVDLAANELPQGFRVWCFFGARVSDVVYRLHAVPCGVVLSHFYVSHQAQHNSEDSNR